MQQRVFIQCGGLSLVLNTARAGGWRCHFSLFDRTRGREGGGGGGISRLPRLALFTFCATWRDHRCFARSRAGARTRGVTSTSTWCVRRYDESTSMMNTACRSRCDLQLQPARAACCLCSRAPIMSYHSTRSGWVCSVLAGFFLVRGKTVLSRSTFVLVNLNSSTRT